MAQAVTAVRAYVREVDEPLTKRFWQYLVIETTAANTDVTYDFGLYVAGSLGTFWTAVSGTAPGALALSLIQSIATQANLFLGVTSPELINRVKVASAGANQYQEATSNAAETVTFHSGDAPTAGVYMLVWELQPNTHGVKSPVS